MVERSRPGTAIVVGGSVGGLMAALALTKVGYATSVFERSRAGLTSYGQGIRVHPAILDFFDEVVGPNSVPAMTRLRERRVIDRHGTVVATQLEDGYSTHWSVLHRALRHAYTGEYHLASTVDSASQDHDRATVHLADGREPSADLVLFADGIGSAGRRELSPRSRPEYAGYVAWRGTAPASALAPSDRALLSAGLTIQILAGSHLHLYPVAAEDSDEPLFNFVWYRNVAEGSALNSLMTGTDGQLRQISVPTGLLRHEHLSVLLDAATKDLAPQLAAVIHASTPSVQVIFDVVTEKMVDGRIGLLGDAAFVARPHLGAGTAKAAENALGLVAALGSNETTAGLAQWEATQIGLGRQLVERSRRLGDLYQFVGTYPGDPAIDDLFAVASLLPRASSTPTTPS